MSLLFLIPLLTGLWSQDQQEWRSVVRIKLPLLFLPIAFAYPFHFSKKQWHGLFFLFIAIIFAATIWSMYYYINNFAAINLEYLKAKTIRTPLENDHVRFSWLASMVILIIGAFLFNIKNERKIILWLLALVAVWLIIYLHILAARTGLISFYIIVFGVAVWFGVKKNQGENRKLKYGVLLAVLVILPFIAYRVLPTFQNRVKYFLYDFNYSQKFQYLPGGNDAVRAISLKAGWSIMNQHPLQGVGFGDIRTVSGNWYQESYPQMVATDKIYPSSEWLIYGAGAGWIGFFIFSYVMIIPFFIKTNHRLLWFLLNVIVALSFIADIGLEVQFGVFIYSFFILATWRWLNPEKI